MNDAIDREMSYLKVRRAEFRQHIGKDTFHDALRRKNIKQDVRLSIEAIRRLRSSTR